MTGDYVRKRPTNFISYQLSHWPTLATATPDRILAPQTWGQVENIPRYSTTFAERLRRAAAQALANYEAHHGGWTLIGRHIVMIRIVSPYKTKVNPSEVFACVKQTNAGLFYPAQTQELDIRVQYERDTKAGVFCTICKVFGNEFVYAA